MSKEYHLRPSSSDAEPTKSKIIADLNQRIGAKQDCKIMIQPLDFRGVGALNAYWMMIDRIVVWDAAENGFKKGIWHEWFMREAGLTYEFDNMPLWELKYKEIIKKHSGHFCYHNWDRWFIEWLDESRGGDEKERKYLYIRKEEKTRSISNKGDVTKDEMSRLLMTVIKFGASNDVPDCFIEDREFKRMVEACGR